MGSQGRSAWWTPVPLKWGEPMISMPGSPWTEPRPGLDRTLGQRTAHWGDSGVWSERGQVGHQVLLGSEGGWWAGTPCPPHGTGRECLVGPLGEAESSPCRPAGSWSPVSFSLYSTTIHGDGQGSSHLLAIAGSMLPELVAPKEACGGTSVSARQGQAAGTPRDERRCPLPFTCQEIL